MWPCEFVFSVKLDTELISIRFLERHLFTIYLRCNAKTISTFEMHLAQLHEVLHKWPRVIDLVDLLKAFDFY